MRKDQCKVDRKGRVKTVLLILNSILLVICNVALALAITGKLDIKKDILQLSSWLRKYWTSNDKKLKMMDISRLSKLKKLKLLEKIEIMYIEKSNIRHYVPFMNAHVLIIIMFIIFIISFKPINSILGFIPSSMLISAVVSLIPIFVLDLLSRYNADVVRKMLSEYISVLNRWCSVKEDIIYAFEKSLDSGIGEPLHTFIRDMVVQVNRGMDTSDALDMLQLKVDNPQFGDFIINVKQSIKNRGDIIKLLTNLEEQFYKIDEEYNRRRISTYKDRMTIYLVMFGVIIVAYLFIRSAPKIEAFYMGTLVGKLLLMIFCGMYALGFYLTIGITRFKY